MGAGDSRPFSASAQPTRSPEEGPDARGLSRQSRTPPMPTAPRQGEALADSHALRAEAGRLAKPDGPLPRPPGYCLFELCLESVEFWGNDTERLHERLRYDRDEGGWKHRYLQP
ncbi:pyridoxamine 5'-phosphate oxidase [Pseudomonas aeruginosa]|nr:pyridoxamine 5'-phosphate oxidase [Pseudomonas aeruginosa]